MKNLELFLKNYDKKFIDITKKNKEKFTKNKKLYKI